MMAFLLGESAHAIRKAQGGDKIFDGENALQSLNALSPYHRPVWDLRFEFLYLQICDERGVAAASGTLLLCQFPQPNLGFLLRGFLPGFSRQVQAAVFLCKHSFSGEYLVIAVASSAPPILNPSVLIQPRFAKSPIATPALAIMNLTVWSVPPTLRFVTDLQSIA
jgi:hypothetical protein